MSISSLVDGRLDLQASAHLSEEDYIAWTRRVTPQHDDVVFSYETRIGQAAIIPEGLCCALGRRMGLLRIDKTKVDPLFALYTYLGPIFQNTIRLKTIHGSTVDRILLTEIGKFPFLLPHLVEQQKIAAILSTCDELIALTERLCAALKERKKGLMQHLLTGVTRFPGCSKPWHPYKIGDLLEEVKRPVEWDDNSTYNLISIRRRSGGLFLRESRKGKEIATKKMSVALSGDFLISKMQIVHGASGLTTPKFDGMHISGSYISLVTRNPKILDIRFFDWISRTPYFYNLTYLSSYGVHIEKMTFNLNNFLNRTIKIPGSVEEQAKIVEVLELAEKEIQLYEEKLMALQQQKKGLMQRLLTGEVRVNI